MAYDARLTLAPRRAPDPQVAIVDIDEASLERVGRWPWPRDTMAQLATALFDRHQARLVAFDVLFPEADLSGNAAALDELARRGLRDTPEARAFFAGVVPFLAGDAVKIAIAAALLPSASAIVAKFSR